jgi:hypothetical protein
VRKTILFAIITLFAPFAFAQASQPGETQEPSKIDRKALPPCKEDRPDSTPAGCQLTADQLEERHADFLAKEAMRGADKAAKPKMGWAARTIAKGIARDTEKCVRKRGFSEFDCERIVKRQVWIGMTDAQAVASWGRPTSINSTVTSSGRSDQWVYEGYNWGTPTISCLYVENGVVRAMQLSH